MSAHGSCQAGPLPARLRCRSAGGPHPFLPPVRVPESGIGLRPMLIR